jgi:threonine/homoserine/homoserine lactone efflux protein
MKVSDWLVRILVVATFFALLVAPDKYGAPMGFICLVAVGAWAIFYPQGVLGWAKDAHPTIEVEDPSLWWVPRLIGFIFLVLALFVMLALFHDIAGRA